MPGPWLGMPGPWLGMLGPRLGMLGPRLGMLCSWARRVVAGGRVFCSLTQGVSPVKLNSWASDSADSIPIGDCASEILALQLQCGRNCREGISARSRSRKYSPGFVRPLLHHFSLHRAPYSATSGLRTLAGGWIPAPVRSLGASQRGAVGFVLLSAS